jgi:hypothetical protein
MAKIFVMQSASGVGHGGPISAPGAMCDLQGGTGCTTTVNADALRILRQPA